MVGQVLVGMRSSPPPCLVPPAVWSLCRDSVVTLEAVALVCPAQPCVGGTVEECKAVDGQTPAGL